jgi:hypothetical protein
MGLLGIVGRNLEEGVVQRLVREFEQLGLVDHDVALGTYRGGLFHGIAYAGVARLDVLKCVVGS